MVGSRTLRWLFLACVALTGGCAATPDSVSLNERQQSALDAAQVYLNQLHSFQARFTQSGTFGSGSGWVWVDRPGRLRIEYAGPRAQEMVANGGLFVIYNHANGATTTMPVTRLPLGLLLAQRISFSGGVAITAFKDEDIFTSLTLTDTSQPERGSLTFVLQKNPLLLVQVTAVDIRGRSFTLALTNLNASPVVTPDLFRLPGQVQPSA